MKKSVSFFLVLVLFFSIAVPVSANTNRLIEYPEYPEYLPRNYDYSVSVTQSGSTINIPVYNGVLQDEIFLNDKYRRFCEFAFDGEPVTINITVNIDMTSFEVLPSSKKLPTTVSGNVISVKLSQPENITVRLNGDYNTCLSIFAESPETEIPSKEDSNVIYCDAGLNNITGGEVIDDEIIVGSNQILYLAPGALLSARVTVNDDYSTVCGRGAILDPEPNRTKNTEKKSYLLMTEWGVDHLSISGIKLLDARTFNITLSGTTDSDITDVKILSNQISTDGISYWYGTKRITTGNCYLYVNDNALVIGGVEDIHIEDMTIGTGYATFFPQGPCTNVTCDNIDIFRTGSFYKSTLTQSAAVAQNITISNVRSTDALKFSYFVWCSNQNSGVKDVVFENIALPKTITYWYRISDTSGTSYPTSNYSFTFNNVWRGDTQFTATDVTYDESIATTAFGENFDADKAMANLSVNQTASYIAEKIYVRDCLLPNFSSLPQTVDGIRYFDARGVLAQLGYNVNYTDNILSFSNSKASYSVEVGKYEAYKNGFKKHLSKQFINTDGSVLMPVTALSEMGITTYSYDENTKTLTIDYIPTGENMLINSDFENGETLDWICYMFSALNETEEESGKSMLVTPHAKYPSNDSGIAQYISDDLFKNGPGKYHLEADIKINTGYENNTANNNVIMGITTGAWSLTGSTSKYSTFALTENWQTFSFDIEITETELSKYKNSYFYVGTDKSEDGLKSFYIDNVSMTKIVSENELEVNVNTIDGASIRLNNQTGIRFYTTVDIEKITALRKDGARVEMGTLIAPCDLLDGEELTFESEANKINVKYTSQNYYISGDFKGIVGSIVNIKETTEANPTCGNITRDFIGRGYVKVEKNGETLISYADYNSTYARSLAYIANKLQNDLSNQSLYNAHKALVDKWAGFLYQH